MIVQLIKIKFKVRPVMSTLIRVNVHHSTTLNKHQLIIFRQEVEKDCLRTRALFNY